MAQLTPKEVLEKPLLRIKPTTEEFQRFNQELDSLNRKLNPNETEEHNKALIRDFLLDSFYRGHNEINTSGDIDDAIYDGNNSSFPVTVLLEAKSPSNKSEFPTKNNLNCKAMQETILYFMRERCIKENTAIKYILITNGYEWFVFDARDYQQYFYENRQLKTLTIEFLENRSIYKTTKQYYEQIALPHIEKVKDELNYVYFDIRDAKSPRTRMDIYKFLSPYHLLKRPLKHTDSNALNKEFYNELLHIIGLEEVKEKTKLVIKRKSEGKRDDNSLLEATLYRLEMSSNMEKVPFETALNLVITWVNRILFLKLLESQLISYHPKDSRDAYTFLSIDKIRDYGELNELFFMVLAKPINERSNRVKEKYNNVPYLNSSLFEMTKNEQTICIDALQKGGTMPTYKQTVLKDQKGKRLQTKLDTLDYLFRFLDAYDFGAEQGDSLTQDKSKTLINASVLGLIFEKINGYKDGSFFTPGIITQYMCHETITSAVLQKFNERKGWNCEDVIQLRNKIEDRKEANDIINSLTICDPAVGSGHFLVSALNEIIAIKSQLGVLQDINGYWLKEWKITVDNDELCICDGEGEIFHYNPKSVDSQRVQETLFNEKRYLIEHCLFGVDLNPNSVNICRLRLWIELLKNAFYRADGQLETLPNIDINIKCGNSLISRFPIEKSIASILRTANQSIMTYRQAIDNYQNAHSKEDKHALEQVIQDIKHNISSDLRTNDPTYILLNKKKREYYDKYEQTLIEVKLSSADKKRKKKLEDEIAKYQQVIDDIQSNKLYKNALEWRFEFPEVLDEDGTFIGFDIVIGNPPYISAPDQLKYDELKKQRQWIADSKRFNSLCSKWDLYIPFLEMGIRHLCRNSGFMAMIVPYSVTNQTYGKLIREKLIRDYSLYEISDLKGTKIFENAAVINCILFAQKKTNQDRGIRITRLFDRFINLAFTQPIHKLILDSKTNIWNLSQEKQDSNKHASFHVLGDYCYVSKGMVLYSEDGLFTNKDLVSDFPDTIHCRKYIEAKDIEKYEIQQTRYIEYDTERVPDKVSRPTFRELYDAPKLITNCLGELKVTVDMDEKYICQQGLRLAVRWKDIKEVDNKSITSSIKKYSSLSRHERELLSEDIDLKYILGIMASKYGKELLNMQRAGDYHIVPEHIRNIPIATATSEQQQPIISLVDRILAAKKADPTANTSELENQIDELVYDLYDLTEPEKEIIRK